MQVCFTGSAQPICCETVRRQKQNFTMSYSPLLASDRKCGTWQFCGLTAPSWNNSHKSPIHFSFSILQTGWKISIDQEPAESAGQTRYLSSPPAATSHGKTWKNTRFRAPVSSPKQSPCNIHAAITMCFATSRRKPARIYAHGNTRWQQSCSHSNAICNHRFQNTL